MEENKYGLLLNKDIKLHRKYFQEMVKLIGINCIYRGLKPNKKWTQYTEIDANYFPPIVVGCIFDQHPDQKTMKKLGWVSELQEDASLIHVPYDLPDIQVGCLFIVPSGIDQAQGRLFRVTQLSNSIVYPASITCQIVPEYQDTFSPGLLDHTDSSMKALNEEGDGNL